MPAREWTRRDDIDLRRWFSTGMGFKTIGDSFSPPRSVQDVVERLQFLGYLGGTADRLPSNAMALARAALAEQVALAKREMAAADRKNPNKL